MKISVNPDYSAFTEETELSHKAFKLKYVKIESGLLSVGMFLVKTATKVVYRNICYCFSAKI